MFRSDLGKEGVCSKSATKMFYRNKFLVNECIFKLVFHCEILSYFVEVGVLNNVTGKHSCWSLFLITLQGPATQVFPTEICNILKTLIFKNNCIFVKTVLETANEA